MIDDRPWPDRWWAIDRSRSGHFNKVISDRQSWSPVTDRIEIDPTLGYPDNFLFSSRFLSWRVLSRQLPFSRGSIEISQSQQEYILYTKFLYHGVFIVLDMCPSVIYHLPFILIFIHPFSHHKVSRRLENEIVTFFFLLVFWFFFPFTLLQRFQTIHGDLN